MVSLGGLKKKYLTQDNSSNDLSLIFNRVFERKNLGIEMMKMVGGWSGGRAAAKWVPLLYR